jgi:hypothetical protein
MIVVWIKKLGKNSQNDCATLMLPWRMNRIVYSYSFVAGVLVEYGFQGKYPKYQRNTT